MIKELTLDDYTKLKLEQLHNILKQFGVMETQDKTIQYIKKLESEYNNLLNNGLDIGILIKCIIKGKIVLYNNEIMFLENKTNKLYEIR